MAVRLTRGIIDQLQAQTRDYFVWDAALSGFGVKVTPSCAKIYVVQYRPKGSRSTRRYTIGRHADPWKIDAARQAASELLAMVRLGHDPQDRHREARAAEADRKAQAKALSNRRAETFETVVPRFIERYAKPRNRTWVEARRVLTGSDVSALAARPLSEIRRAEVLAVTDTVAERSPTAARVLFAHLRKFFNWCLERELIAVSPCAGTRGPAPAKARDRWLDDEEIKLFWSACEGEGEPFGPLLQLLLLTGQRREEVSGMSWSEVDLIRGEWIIPGSRAKNGQAHAVDLSPPAVDILQRLKRGSGLVFTTTGQSPVSGQQKAKERVARRMDDASETPVPTWRLHDLRRTAATCMARLGHPPHVVEAVLNHRSGVRGGLVAVYQHYDHRPQRRAALLAWGQHLADLNGATVCYEGDALERSAEPV